MANLTLEEIETIYWTLRAHASGIGAERLAALRDLAIEGLRAREIASRDFERAIGLENYPQAVAGEEMTVDERELARLYPHLRRPKPSPTPDTEALVGEGWLTERKRQLEMPISSYDARDRLAEAVRLLERQNGTIRRLQDEVERLKSRIEWLRAGTEKDADEIDALRAKLEKATGAIDALLEAFDANPTGVECLYAANAARALRKDLKQPKLPDDRCDHCDNGIESDWEWCPWCGEKLHAALKEIGDD